MADIVGVLGSSSLIYFKDSQRQVADTYSTPVIYLIGQICDFVCTLLATSITVVNIQDVNNLVSLEASQIAKYREKNVGSQEVFLLFLFLVELISIVNNGISTQVDEVTWNEEDYEVLEVSCKAVVMVFELGYTGYVLNKQSRSLKKTITEPRYTASRHSHLTRGV